MLFSKGMGFIYTFFLYKRKTPKKVNNKKILVIFGGHIGNALLNIDLLLRIKHLFPIEDGWQLNIFCNDGLWKVCETIADVSGFNRIQAQYPTKDGGTRFSEVLQTMKAVRGMEFDTIVVNLAHIMPLAAYLVAALQANRSIGVFDDIDRRNSKLFNDIGRNVGSLRWYFERAYNTPIWVPYNTQEVHRQKEILKQLGDTEYAVRIFPIPKLCDFTLPSEKYFTVTLDSTTSARRWAPEKFAEVINYVLEHYDYQVCFTGNTEAEPIYQTCIQHIKQPERTINYVNKTSFNEWVELLRGSSFHLGVDSGSIHVASSVGTQAFCLTGVWDGKRVLPYQIERQESGTTAPICVYMKDVDKLPCYACLPQRGLMGSENDECYAAYRRGEPCMCLQSIQVNDVISSITKYLSAN